MTPELVAATNAAVEKSGVSIAVDGTYVELSYADEDKDVYKRQSIHHTILL